MPLNMVRVAVRYCTDLHCGLTHLDIARPDVPAVQVLDVTEEFYLEYCRALGALEAMGQLIDARLNHGELDSGRN